MTVRVLRPGLLSSIQDHGRFGWQHLGIVPCGAMDNIAQCMANVLVGNEEASATLECTIVGPELLFSEDSLVAFYGATFESKTRKLPANRPVLLKAGTTVNLGSAIRGARAYLAIAGGFVVPEVLGSRSTYMPARFGGFEGRPLHAGDKVPTHPNLVQLSTERYARLKDRTGSDPLYTVRWSAPPITLPTAQPQIVRAMEGRHYGQFSETSRETFFSKPWRVSVSSNRMGYRLEGPKLSRDRPLDVLSEPTCLGTVQVPNDGHPIVLMADHQTTGGYPKIAEVASADVGYLGQLPPGHQVRFSKCSVEEAQTAEDDLLARLGAIRDSVRNMF